MKVLGLILMICLIPSLCFGTDYKSIYVLCPMIGNGTEENPKRPQIADDLKPKLDENLKPIDNGILGWAMIKYTDTSTIVKVVVDSSYLKTIDDVTISKSDTQQLGTTKIEAINSFKDSKISNDISKIEVWPDAKIQGN